jgi:hypothetical protein
MYGFLREMVVFLIVWKNLIQLEVVGRQSPGLIQAKNVHITQGFYRIGLLNQSPFIRYQNGADGVGHDYH